jgi:hypothetical protein
LAEKGSEFGDARSNARAAATYPKGIGVGEGRDEKEEREE